ncbi:O-antigen/teichoic acid export membrane protein [Azospirillum sp. OGB3]|uniref:lipopolysaccharide biosynthesis protein n=1 Tax=Azospirillum sp. OGB3 TaxID=2587012 RepID=UPI001606636F|nr:oligosaccharide flippase family protein [Azospirillum sp. OGB3]MBB3264704.1 O-antigen/teichoic acid export membrane protein [Azospirillum sp. OGB3]
MMSSGFAFFATRIAVGVLGFAAVAVFSRIVTPEAYGHYALVMAAAAAINACGFSWMGLFVLRKCGGDAAERDAWLSTVVTAFLVVACGVLAILGAVVAFYPGMNGIDYVLYLPVIAILISWFDLSIQMSRARLKGSVFAAKSFAKALFGLALGSAFVLIGWKEEGLLLGTSIGFLLVTAIWLRSDLKGIALRWPARERVGLLLTFGGPLMLSLMVGWALDFADRFLIYWFIGEAAAGAYAMAFDLAKQPIMLVASAASLVTLPMASRAFDSAGPRAARPIMAQNLTILLLVCLPLVLMEVISAQGIVGLLLGEAYRETGAAIMPLVALSVFISILRIYHFDLSLHLTKKTGYILKLTMLTAVLNIGANLFLIPRFGVIGAAYGSLAAQLGWVVAATILMPRAGVLAVPVKDLLKVTTAALLFAAGLKIAAMESDLLLVQLAPAGSLYLLALAVLNPANLMGQVRIALARLKRTRSPA